MSSVAIPIPPLRLRRVTVAEYHRMIRDGYFAENERCELIDGMILEKMPRNPPHDAVLNTLWELIYSKLPQGLKMRIQSAITLSDSEPEPDIAVVRQRDYSARHPQPADVTMVIEISDSSIDLDRGAKSEMYARAGIAPYLIVDVPARTIEVRNEPRDGRYAQSQTHQVGDEVTLNIAGTPVVIEVAAVFAR